LTPVPKPGSHHVAAEIVAGALLEKGFTNLMVKLGKEIAERGDTCWINDKRMATVLVKPGGGQYHRESIGRARRLMARAGVIESKRIYPQHWPDGAKRHTPHGTTSKRIMWKALGLRNPMTRGDRRLRLTEQRKEVAQHEAPRARPRVAIPPELAALVAGVAPSSEPTHRVRSERPIHRERHTDEKIQARAAEARRLLEQWDREKRGPP
jgi:hypothetical protein